MTKISLPQDIIFLASFPKFQVSTSQNHGNTAFYNFGVFIWVVHSLSGSTLVSLHRNDSELLLTQFNDPARIIFSHLRPSRRKFLFLKILFFSLLSQNFKSLPCKTTEIRPFYNFGIFIWVVHSSSSSSASSSS